MLSKKFKLQADSFAPGTLSHQLYVYCSINGMRSGRAKIRKTVNYYRFKEFVEQEMKVANFAEWYFDNKHSITFLAALAQFINKAEGREAYYIAPTPTMSLLNRYIAHVSQANKTLADMLVSM